MRYIDVKGKAYRVKKYKGIKKCNPDNAYIIGDIALPCYDGVESKNAGIYPVLNKIVRPINKKKFSIDKIYDDSIEDIERLIDGGKIADIDGVDVLMSDGDVYVPSINEDDNELSSLAKQCLGLKNISFKSYEPRFETKHDLTNLKALLTSHGKLSFDKLLKVLEKFDLELEITARDREGCVNPMGQEVKMTIE